MYLTSKDRKILWELVTKKTKGWKPTALTTANADIFVGLFKERMTQFGLNAIINIPTLATGAVDLNQITISGDDFWKVNLGDIFNLLLQPRNITLNQVREYLGWFIGDDSSTHGISTDTNIKVINLNVPGNVGLVNQHNIRLR